MAEKIPPFHPQETDFSCAVACLRMVLDHLGVTKTESELGDLCDCTIFGTPAVELVRAARSLGFTDSRKYSLTLEELMDLTRQGYFPIVYVVLSAETPTPDVHSLVVVSVTDAGISVLDPQQGLCLLTPEEFIEMWSPMKNLAVVIARSGDFSGPER